MAASYELRDYYIQAKWIEEGSAVLSEVRQAFDERYKHRNSYLVIHGLDSEGKRIRLLSDGFRFAIDDYIPNPQEAVSYRSRQHEAFRLMDVRYMPDKLLRCPLP